MKLVYRGPSPEVFIAAAGLTAARDTELDVPDEIAGRAASGEPGAEGYDPGEGLLAQVGVWERAGGRSAKRGEA